MDLAAAVHDFVPDVGHRGQQALVLLAQRHHRLPDLRQRGPGLAELGAQAVDVMPDAVGDGAQQLVAHLPLETLGHLGARQWHGSHPRTRSDRISAGGCGL